MDFLDPKKRKAHQKRLFIGYGLISILVLFITTILVFMAYGYKLNLRTGDITQSGLVFMSSQPESAHIYINGVAKGSTAKKFVLPAGEYNFELRRDGYRPWQKKLNLEGGHIERLFYPLMVPIELKTEEFGLYVKKPLFASQSPDLRWLVLKHDGKLGDFEIVDLNSPVAGSRTLSIPKNIIASNKKNSTLEPLEWSSDSKHLLMKHSYLGGAEFLLLNRERPASSLNINAIIKQPITNMVLRDKKFDQFYIFDEKGKTISSSSINGGNVQVFARGVINFVADEQNLLLYATTEKAKTGRVNVNLRDNDQTFTLRDFPANSAYALGIRQYKGRRIVLAGAYSEHKIYIYRDPTSALKQNPNDRLIPAATMRLNNYKHFSFSQNSRFIAVQAGSDFVVYDADRNRIYRYNTKLPVSESQQAVWIDSYRLSVVSDQKLFIFDFDGLNQQSLTASYNDFSVYPRPDFKSYFTVSLSNNVTGRAALLRTELIAQPRSTTDDQT